MFDPASSTPSDTLSREVLSRSSSFSPSSTLPPSLPARSPLRVPRQMAPNLAAINTHVDSEARTNSKSLPSLPPPSPANDTTESSLTRSYSTSTRGPPSSGRRMSTASSLSARTISTSTSYLTADTNKSPSLNPLPVAAHWASSPPSIAPTSTPAPAAPPTSRLKHALLELLSSERVYASDLALIRHIHIPLAFGQAPSFVVPDSNDGPSTSASTISSPARGPEKAPMAAEDVRVIFSNTEDLAVFADRFAERIEGILALGGVLAAVDTLSTVDGESEDVDVRVLDAIGDLFVEVAPIMKSLYTTYITRQPLALSRLTTLTSPASAAMQNYLTRTRSLTERHTHAWDLPSLLIKPVQRLLKYPLLLQTLISASPILSSTPSSSTSSLGPDIPLVRAKTLMEEIARDVNEARRKWEIVKAILEGYGYGPAFAPPPMTTDSPVVENDEREEADEAKPGKEKDKQSSSALRSFFRSNTTATPSRNNNRPIITKSPSTPPPLTLTPTSSTLAPIPASPNPGPATVPTATATATSTPPQVTTYMKVTARRPKSSSGPPSRTHTLSRSKSFATRPSNSNGPLASVRPSITGDPDEDASLSPLGRIASLKGKLRTGLSIGGIGASEEARSAVAELTAFDLRLKACDTVLRDLFKLLIVEWPKAVRDSLGKLGEWVSRFNAVAEGTGTVVIASEIGDADDPMKAFATLVRALLSLWADLDANLQSTMMPLFLALLTTISRPQTLVRHALALHPLHLQHLSTPYTKARSSVMLASSSRTFLALQSQLRIELPVYLELFEKGLGGLIAKMGEIQGRFWEECWMRWSLFGLSVGVEVRMPSDVKVWDGEGEARRGSMVTTSSAGSDLPPPHVPGKEEDVDIGTIFRDRWEPVEKTLSELLIVRTGARVARVRRSDVSNLSINTSGSNNANAPARNSATSSLLLAMSYDVLSSPAFGAPTSPMLTPDDSPMPTAPPSTFNLNRSKSTASRPSIASSTSSIGGRFKGRDRSNTITSTMTSQSASSSAMSTPSTSTRREWNAAAAMETPSSVTGPPLSPKERERKEKKRKEKEEKAAAIKLVQERAKAEKARRKGSVASNGSGASSSYFGGGTGLFFTGFIGGGGGGLKEGEKERGKGKGKATLEEEEGREARRRREEEEALRNVANRTRNVLDGLLPASSSSPTTTPAIAIDTTSHEPTLPTLEQMSPTLPGGFPPSSMHFDHHPYSTVVDGDDGGESPSPVTLEMGLWESMYDPDNGYRFQTPGFSPVSPLVPSARRRISGSSSHGAAPRSPPSIPLPTPPIAPLDIRAPPSVPSRDRRRGLSASAPVASSVQFVSQAPPRRNTNVIPTVDEMSIDDTSSFLSDAPTSEEALYVVSCVHPFMPPRGISHLGLPFLVLEVGDIIDILVEDSHPSTHEDLPIETDGGDDCLLIGRDEKGTVGWCLASYVMPLV